MIQKVIALLNLLLAAYETADRDNDLHIQRACGVASMAAGLDAELLNCLQLMREEARLLWAQRTALRMLAGRKLSERDAHRLRHDENFSVARALARDATAVKEGQVAA